VPGRTNSLDSRVDAFYDDLRTEHTSKGNRRSLEVRADLLRGRMIADGSWFLQELPFAQIQISRGYSSADVSAEV
jgi:hypothetical protein